MCGQLRVSSGPARPMVLPAGSGPALCVRHEGKALGGEGAPSGREPTFPAAGHLVLCGDGAAHPCSRAGPTCLHSSISHSVLSEMQVIEQETPVSAKSSRAQLDLFDDVGTFASGPPK